MLISNDKGLYLLIQRSVPFSDGTKWDIPGGRIKPSEHLESALMRELREEIGVRLDGQRQLIKAQDIFVPEVDLHVVRLIYTARFNGDIVLSEEHQSLKWVTHEDALALDLDPYLREVLESL